MTKKEQAGEHAATNKEVDASNKKWSITQIAATCAALSIITGFVMTFWSTAVEAGGKGTFATVQQHAAIVQQVNGLDAGTAKKEDVQRVEAKVDRMESKLDRLIEIQLKQKGGR